MNLDQISPDNIREILNQIKLSLISELENKGIYLEGKCYSFEIEPKYVDSRYDDKFKFKINVKKEEVKGFWGNSSKYEIDIEIRRNVNSYSWSPHDTIKMSDKEHQEAISKIYELVDVEYIRRDIAQKNKKISDYIGLIKTTVKAEMKRDETIHDILN